MPHERVAAEVVTLLGGSGGDDLAFGVVEDVSLWFGEEPLWTVSDVA